MQQEPRFTIKASLGSEIRRFNLEKNDFSVLKETCIRVFALPPDSAPIFKYTDDENDVVTISSSAELAEAFRVHSDLLRIAVDVTPSVIPAPRGREPLVVPKPSAVAPVSSVPQANEFAAPAPASSSSIASAVPAPAVPAPAPIHSTANTCSSSLEYDRDISQARAELTDIRTRFQSARDKAEKARLRPLLMAAKGRLMSLHETAKSHKQLAQQARQQAKLASKIAHKVEKSERKADKVERKQAEKADKKEEKSDKKEDKSDKKEDKSDKSDKSDNKKDYYSSKPLKEQMLLGRFVRDVTIPDGFEMDGGRPFVKTWRFRNDSTRAWAAGTRLLFVGKNSDRMGALDSLPLTATLQPGEECDVSVSLVSPPEPGRYTAYFRLADAAGRKFGQRVWVQIHVTADSSSSSDESSDKASASSVSAPLIAAPALAPSAVPAVAPAAPSPSAVPAKKKWQKEKPVFEPSEQELVQYGAHLRTLGSMGFLNTKRNLRLLKKFAGNLDRTVEVLLRKPEKNKPQATA